MNERIRELADRIWADEYWSNPNTDKLLPAQLNKFAELIVRECCDIFVELRTRPADLAVLDVKKHFGVEE
jgi:hypothetical protein